MGDKSAAPAGAPAPAAQTAEQTATAAQTAEQTATAAQTVEQTATAAQPAQQTAPAQDPVVRKMMQQLALTEFFDGLKTEVDAKGMVKKTVRGAGGAQTTREREISYFSDMLRQEELRDVIEKADFSKLPNDLFSDDEKQALKARLLRKISKSAAMPVVYRAFSGNYSEDAQAKYDEIKAAIERGDMVTGGTFKYKPENLVSNGKGLNNEQLDHGIVQTHAYSVLGVEMRGNIRYVKLRNPWGTGTASYTRDPETGEVESTLDSKSKEGIFLMEFNDFLAAFDHVDIS
jgi:hypothetical protein